VYYQSGKFDEAVQQMQKALELDPNDARRSTCSARLTYSQQKLDEAEKAFNNAVELKPDLAAAYTGLGNVQLARKNYADAIKMLQKATGCSRIKLKPGWPWGKRMRRRVTRRGEYCLSKCQQTSSPARCNRAASSWHASTGTP